MSDIANKNPIKFAFYFVLTFFWMIAQYIPVIFPSFEITKIFIGALFFTTVGGHLTYISFRNAIKQKYLLGVLLVIPISILSAVGIIAFVIWGQTVFTHVVISNFT